jgi:tetratricopeptide (TPR) repeat protein
MALNPSIEVHQIQTSTMANSMVVGKQASKIGGVAATTISPAGYYLLNLNDMIPVWPSVGQNVPESVQNIRPELVLKASGPVSIGSLHPETTMLATKSVLDATINKFVADLESLSLIPLDSMEWTEAFHARGLNAGLMGLVAARAQLPHIQEGLIIEMVARTVKRALRSQLRKAILHFREVQALRVDEELATIALGTVQALLNPPVDQGQLQWQCELLEAVSRRYEYGIEYETFKHLPRQALFFAISHHCGLKFREGLNVDSDFIEQSDFIEFLPQINGGGRGPLPKMNLEKLTLTEDVMMAEIAERVFPDHEAWNRSLSRASIAKSFGALALYQHQQGKIDDALKSIRLARCIAPATHSITSQIILNEMQIGLKEDSKLDEISLTFQRALTVTKSHLGAHHPYQLVLSEQFTKSLVGIGSIEALLIALRIRQEILAESTKILGKTHSKTKSQYELIGDLQMRLGTMDEAISSYSESFKYGSGAIAKSQILLKLAKCYEGKEEIEEALAQAQQCRKLVESELPKMIQQDQRQILLALQEEVYETLARLSQNVFSSAINPNCDAEIMMISGAMEGHIKCAIDCYERLFEMQRSRSVESNTQEGERLISLLQSILSLKLKLASPAEKTVIKCARQSKIQVDESVMHDLVVKLLTAPTAPSSFIEKLLIKAGKPETMKEVDEELRAIVQFCGI